MLEYFTNQKNNQMTTIGKIFSSWGYLYVSVTQKKKVPFYFLIKKEEIIPIYEKKWREALKRKKIKPGVLTETQEKNILELANLFQKKKTTAKVVKITRKYTGQRKPRQNRKIVNL